MQKPRFQVSKICQIAVFRNIRFHFKVHEKITTDQKFGFIWQWRWRVVNFYLNKSMDFVVLFSQAILIVVFQHDFEEEHGFEDDNLRFMNISSMEHLDVI